MDKEKQIEEMARISCADGANKGLCEKCGFNKGCWRFKDAEAIYNAGYRKQKEGEWGIRKIGDGGTTRTCSNCLISQTVNVYNGKVMFKYCPYCGAKMKGGAEK